MEIKQVSLTHVSQDPSQPRKYFDEEKLTELKKSIEKFGLLSPIAVRCDENDSSKFIIVAGERRYRALSELVKENPKFEQISVAIVNKDDYQAIALIENIQRENLSI